MIFVDTGAWFSALVPSDRRHQEAATWLASNRETLITTDYVVDETLTLLKARGERGRAIQVAEQFFAGDLALLHFLNEDELLAAFQVFQQYADKEWSFTDCTSKVIMERLGITTAFAFDQHFRQFGSVAVVP